MASPWRKRSLCILIAGTPAPAALRQVSAVGAFLETNARPSPGDRVELRHPEAGPIEAVVDYVSRDGIGIEFARSEGSVAFALAAITADMSKQA